MSTYVDADLPTHLENVYKLYRMSTCVDDETVGSHNVSINYIVCLLVSILTSFRHWLVNKLY